MYIIKLNQHTSYYRLLIFNRKNVTVSLFCYFCHKKGIEFFFWFPFQNLNMILYTCCIHWLRLFVICQTCLVSASKLYQNLLIYVKLQFFFFISQQTECIIYSQCLISFFEKGVCQTQCKYKLFHSRHNNDFFIGLATWYLLS